ncbi:hypothetical protein IL992_12945 [Microbispora sp. NEAU-D428]|uniref:hypothetical protein n=1 Tax=Microbispora sitophila TaxID=2771537 RepID=UPI00186796E7|nr:hypothetical protein [Microbispora sitophila]MBE3010091.1 hypothetical protein [Microbispora sitophila]
MFRQRAGWIAAGVYLAISAVGAVITAVTGRLDALWAAVLWYPLDDYSSIGFAESPAAAMTGAVGLLTILALKTWMLRQVFTFPPRAARPADRRTVWLRRLLYLAVAHALIPGLPAAPLPDVVGEVLTLALWCPLQVLFALTLRGRLRVFALVTAWPGSAGLAMIAMDEVPEVRAPRFLLFACLAMAAAWQVAVLFGQHRDGRWSRDTVTAGWRHVTVTLATPLAAMTVLSVFIYNDVPLMKMLEEFDVFLAVWLARSARELTGPRGTPPERTPLRPSGPILLAAVLLSFLVLVGPEETGRPSYIGWWYEGPPEALRPEDGARADDESHVAEANARCRDPWPRVRARRQGTAAYFLFEGGGYGVYDPEDTSEGEDPYAAVDDGFLGAAGSSAVVMTYGENEPMCLTVKAFGSAPPLRLTGWERVAEVGVVSRSGRLEVPSYADGGDEGAGARLPNLAVQGPGRYRLRAYARGPEGAEEHLVVVFPGRSAKKVVYR